MVSDSQGNDRKCTFTLGAVWGALKAVTSTMYLSEHTESVLRSVLCTLLESAPGLAGVLALSPLALVVGAAAIRRRRPPAQE